MIKRSKQERLAQQQHDTSLATVYRGVKAQDGALKIYENKLVPMPERKLTFQSRNQQILNKRFDTYSNV